MKFLSRIKHRWHIMKRLLEETNQTEAYYPYAALTGIGQNAVWWAATEHQLDLIVFWHAFTRLGDERPEHPRALARKLRYLKEIESDITLTQEAKLQIRDIRLSMAELSEKRHDFTHSFMDIADPRTDWKFARLRYERKNIRLERKVYDIEQLAELTREITKLFGKIADWSRPEVQPWLKSNRSLIINSSTENPRP